MKHVYDSVFALLTTYFQHSTIILANQTDAPFPQEDSVITILPMSETPMGRPNIFRANRTDGMLTENISGHEAFSVSIQFFNRRHHDAISFARRFNTLVRGSNASIHLAQYGLGFISISNPRDLSAIAQGQWESRSSVDLRLSGVTNENDKVFAVESVEINGKLYGSSTFDEITIPITP